MAFQDTQVGCWGVSKWTSFFAWLQIVGSVFAVSSLIFKLANVDGNPEIEDDKQKLVKGILITFLIFTILQLAFAVLLLIGNQKEKLGLIWAWLIFTVTSIILVIIWGVLAVTAGANFIASQTSAAYQYSLNPFTRNSYFQLQKE